MKTSHAPCSHPSLVPRSAKANSTSDADNKRNRGNDARRANGKSMESRSMAREPPKASMRRNDEGSKRKTEDDHPDTSNHSKSRGRTKTEGASISSKDAGPVADDCQEVYDTAMMAVDGAKALKDSNQNDDAIEVYKVARDSIYELRESMKGSTQYPQELVALEATIQANLSSLLARLGEFSEAATEWQMGYGLDSICPNEECGRLLIETELALLRLFRTELRSKAISSTHLLFADVCFTNEHERDAEKEQSGDENESKVHGPSPADDSVHSYPRENERFGDSTFMSIPSFSEDESSVANDCDDIYVKAKRLVKAAKALKDINENDLAIKLYKMARDSIYKLREGSTEYPPELVALEATVRTNLSSLLVPRPGQFGEGTTERQRPSKLDFKNCVRTPTLAPSTDFDFSSVKS